MVVTVYCSIQVLCTIWYALKKLVAYNSVKDDLSFDTFFLSVLRSWKPSPTVKN
jgi:hypothetical protein